MQCSYVISLLLIADATTIMVKPKDEQCMWEQAVQGDMISHRYDVIRESTSSKVNMRMFGPTEKEIIALKDTDGESLRFIADEEGTYSWCYENVGDTRVIMVFKNSVGRVNVAKASVGGNEVVDTIEKEIQHLQMNSDEVWDSLSTYRRRLEQHEIQTSTALKAQTTFSLLKLVVFAGASLSGVYWMRILFETKRRI